MYKLFYFPGNSNLFPHMVLEELGVPYELSLVDRNQNAHKDPDFLKLNPRGLIPVLIDSELNLALPETAAIALHLIDRHPEFDLAPKMGTAERAKFYRWIMFLTNTVQAEVLTFAYAQRHTTDTSEGAVAAVRTAADARLGEFFDIIEGELLASGGPYLLGRTFTAADLFLLMVSRWGSRISRPPRQRPMLNALLDKLLERPAVIRAFEGEGLSAPFA